MIILYYEKGKFAFCIRKLSVLNARHKLFKFFEIIRGHNDFQSRFVTTRSDGAEGVRHKNLSFKTSDVQLSRDGFTYIRYIMLYIMYGIRLQIYVYTCRLPIHRI